MVAVRINFLSYFAHFFFQNGGKVSIWTHSQHKRGANLLLKVIQCVETQKYSNCSILDIFGIHQQMLTDGTCGHNTSFTEMFPFVFPVFEKGSVLLRQLVLLFSVFGMEE